jgi:hypothetical protein
VRQSRSYGALHETHREADEQQPSSSPETPERSAHRPDYGALHDTEHQVDEQREARAAEERQAALNPRRSWTHYGGMWPHQLSAYVWNKQDIEIRTIRMAENQNSGAEREGEGPETSQSEQAQDQAEIEEARAAIEETRRREAAERARQQERDRSGPER